MAGYLVQKYPRVHPVSVSPCDGVGDLGGMENGEMDEVKEEIEEEAIGEEMEM